MYSRFRLAKKYLHYYFHSANGKGHGIHSPFMFDFVRNVLNNKRHYNAYDIVEFNRSQLKTNPTIIEVHDMGAGSAVSNDVQKKVSTIVRSASKPKKYGQLLYRIVDYYKPQSIIELGTSLGLTTSYLALGNGAASVYTFEGAAEIAAIAKENFERLSLRNVNLTVGNFDHSLPEALKNIEKIDLAFADGNHRKEPTLNYFRQFLLKSHSSTILIFDDIHWSSEMEEAWEIIKAEPSVTVTIDLFFMGLVFFRDAFKVKQHFVIQF